MKILKIILIALTVIGTHIIATIMPDQDLYWKSIFMVWLLSNAYDIDDIKRGLK
jgi:hypothetical protein